MKKKMFQGNPAGAAAIGIVFCFAVAPNIITASLAAEIVLDNVTIRAGTASAGFNQIIVENGNLTREELAKVFSTEASPAIDALIAGFNASRIRIPEISIGQRVGRLVLREFEATSISRGNAARMSVKGLDASNDLPAGGKVVMTSRPITMENVRFDRFLRGLHDGDYTGMAMRATHVLWEGFDLSFPDPKAAAGGIFRFHLGSVEMTTSFAGDIPKASNLEARNVVFLPPKGSALAQSLAPFGYDSVDLGVKLKGSYDAGAKTFKMEEYSLTVNGAGTLAIEGRFENIDKAMYAGDKNLRSDAFANGRVSEISLRYRDAGFFNKWVTATAERENKTTQKVKSDWIANMPRLTTGLLGENAASGKLSKALEQFIDNPATLTISASNNAPINISDLKQAKLPAVLSNVVLDAAVTK